MPDEVASIRNNGIDITHACMEVVLATVPPGDRKKINNLKQIIHQQALAANEDVATVAMRLLVSSWQAYLEAIAKESSLNIMSVAVKPNSPRKEN